MQIVLSLIVRLLNNLIASSRAIATAMLVRGFTGPCSQQLYIAQPADTSLVVDISIVVGLFALCGTSYMLP